MFGGYGVGLVVVVASRCVMDNWARLVDVGNVVSKEMSIDEDYSEEPVDGGDRAAVEGGASPRQDWNYEVRKEKLGGDRNR